MLAGFTGDFSHVDVGIQRQKRSALQLEERRGEERRGEERRGEERRGEGRGGEGRGEGRGGEGEGRGISSKGHAFTGAMPRPLWCLTHISPVHGRLKEAVLCLERGRIQLQNSDIILSG